MIAFEIYLNSQKVCRAGTDGLSALTAATGYILPKQPMNQSPCYI